MGILIIVQHFGLRPLRNLTAMNKSKANKQYLLAEVEWYDSGNFYIDLGHWSSHPIGEV